MDLLQNPFYILTATTRDNRQTIMALAEKRALLLDPNECRQARADLTQPRKRLAAEIAWLPGVGLRRASEVLGYFESLIENSSGMDRLTQFRNVLGTDKMIPIAEVNLLAGGLSRLPDYSSQYVAGRIISEWIIEIASVFENIDPEVIRTTINEERIVSGFPAVTDLSAIEMEIKEQRNFYRQVITSTLNNLSAKERAKTVTEVVVAAINNKENSRLTLVGDLMDWYEVDVQKLLEKEEANIDGLDDKLRAAVSSEIDNVTLTRMVNELIQSVKNWDSFAQPIQIIKRGQGLSHDASYRVAARVRRLAVDLCNKHDRLDFSQQITNMLQEIFAEVDEIAEYLAEDARTLAEFAEQRKQRVKIEALIEKLRTAADGQSSDSILAPMVNQIIQAISNLDAVVQSAEGHRIAISVRDLAICLFNECDKLDFARQLTYALQRVFGGIDEIAGRLAEDAKALDEIAEQRVRLIEAAKKREDEWRREITYEADVGTFFFQNKLRISPEGIEWRGDRWDLDSITRIRWGGTRHSLNGIPTGTTYSIILGNNSNYASIELKDEIIYNNFIDRLWQAVGVRLLTEYLEGLRDGKRYRFGSTVISDYGMELERKRLFSSNDQVFCRWSELVIWNGAGVFCIKKKEDRKLKTSFSYQDEDNIHVLEAAIRMFWKRGGNKLSTLLDE